jgi:ligand-binding sensor domain-containing protein
MNARLIRLFCLVLLFVLAAGKNGARAQDERSFRLYTVSNGLSDNNITSLAQDAYGYIWISTHEGLDRYDGRHFEQFHSGRHSNSLPDEWISHLTWVDQRRLAAFTDMGLHIINTQNGETTNIINQTDQPKFMHKFNTVMAALSDA